MVMREARTLGYSYSVRPLVNTVFISPIMLTGLPSNMDDKVLSHNFFNSLVLVRAASWKKEVK